VVGEVFSLLRPEILGAKAVVATAYLGFVLAGRAHQRQLLAARVPLFLSQQVLWVSPSAPN
jgi:hypothetical protein